MYNDDERVVNAGQQQQLQSNASSQHQAQQTPQIQSLLDIDPPQANNNAIGTAPERSEIARVSVKIPPFWKTNPALWFSQLESQFVVSGITNDTTKYHTVVGSIEASVLSEIADVILQPPTTNMYQTLKTRLLDRFTDSEERRLKKLLRDIELGDRKPSTLLCDMRSLSTGAISDDVLKSLWLQRLPTQMQAILSVSGETLNKLALMADKISDATEQQEIHNVTTSSNSTTSLEQQIAILTKQVQKLTHRRSNSRHNNRNYRSHSASRGNKPFCWYHFKFGSQAKKCQSPCNFQTNNNNMEN